MYIDTTAFLRLDVLQSVGTSASGAAFATSTGDIFEVSCYGPGIFRLRAGPSTKPDYGLVVSRSKACTVAQGEDGTWTFAAGDTTLELAAAPLRFRLIHRGAAVACSITDENFGGWTRLPTFGRLRQGGQWTAAFALASGEPVYGLGEKFGPLNKRGQLIHSHVADSRGVNTGLSYKNAPFAWSPGIGKGAWGAFVNTPALVTHGVGYPDWSHRSYALLVDDEALDLFLFAADTPSGILDCYTQLTGRPAPVPSWGLGLWVSRAHYTTPEEAEEVAAKLRARKIPCDVLTLDARAACEVATCFDFGWDPGRFPDPRAALAAIKKHDLRVCVWEYPYVSVQSPLFAELASRGYLLTTPHGDPYVFGWDSVPGNSASAKVPAPLPDSGIVDFTHPGAYVFWRDAHAPLFADGVDVMSTDFGEQVPEDAVAFNGDTGRRLHNVYPLLYNQCVHDATAKYQRDAKAPPMVLGRAGWTGSQRCPVQWGGDPQSDWEGLAASIRGGLSWGMSGVPYYSSDVGGYYGSQQPTPELYVRWLQAAVFGSHVDNAIRSHSTMPVRIRTDISATLFISEPEDYDGGELTVEDTYGAHSVKLPAGDMIIYPGTMLLMGLGTNGHTASLFPASEVVFENHRLAAAPFVEKFQTFRLTLTPIVLNNAQNVWFLISGKEKAAALREVLEGESQPAEFPAQIIAPTDGNLQFLIDKSAAESLSL